MPDKFSRIELVGLFYVRGGRSWTRSSFIMLRKALFSFSFAILAVSAVVAQDDHKKGEFFVGYSNGQIDTGVDTGDSPLDVLRERENFNGINVAGVYNVSRWFGVKGDISATFNKTDFSTTVVGPGGSNTISAETNNSLYNFLAGVQVKDNSNEGTFKPFAHGLVGAAHARTKVNNFTCTGLDCPDLDTPEETFSDTGFGAVIGGGIDFRLNNRVQIRAIQVDYNPTRIGGEWQNNLRIGAGIVF